MELKSTDDLDDFDNFLREEADRAEQEILDEFERDLDDTAKETEAFRVALLEQFTYWLEDDPPGAEIPEAAEIFFAGFFAAWDAK